MSFIIFETQGQVAKITLHRAEKFNSFIREMALELQAALDKANSDNTIRAILLTGNGKAFCAGQDLTEAIDGSGPGIKRIVEEHYNPIVQKIRAIEKPIVCAVNGVAAGAGANIALCCDVVVACESATFIQAFSKIGLIPDSGGTFFLPRLIGFQRASALMMLGEKVSAKDALQMGMVYKVVEDAQLQAAAMELATNLSQMPTKGIGYTKRLLNESLFTTFEKQIAREGEMQVASTKTHDYTEGVNAFLEKRKPLFKGE